MFPETMVGVALRTPTLCPPVDCDVTGATSRRAKDLHSKQPLVAQMPAGVTCTGTIGNATNACVVQRKNPVGPFGSNVIVQTAGQANKRRFVVRGTRSLWE